MKFRLALCAVQYAAHRRGYSRYYRDTFAPCRVITQRHARHSPPIDTSRRVYFDAVFSPLRYQHELRLRLPPRRLIFSPDIGFQCRAARVRLRCAEAISSSGGRAVRFQIFPPKTMMRDSDIRRTRAAFSRRRLNVSEHTTPELLRAASHRLKMEDIIRELVGTRFSCRLVLFARQSGNVPAPSCSVRADTA